MKARPVAIALASCLVTLVAVLLALNLGTGEKKVERQLRREYAAQDAQFRRAMGVLLGPSILEGNKGRGAAQRRRDLPRDARWGPLLEAGVLIAEYQPTMFHCKVLVVDELLVSVGSTNFDNRSFRLNDEANLNIFDAAFARQQIEVFERDLQRARPITLQAWQQRPWLEKATEQVASLFGAQL